MKLTSIIAPIAFVIAAVPYAQAGLLSYGLCQTGCNTVAVACYAAAGATFGTITAGAGTPAVILGCNAALGKCSATCAALTLLAPIPIPNRYEPSADPLSQTALACARTRARRTPDGHRSPVAWPIEVTHSDGGAPL
ncbi:hypothetical protein OH77DRAFT_1586382 [Trametes cingulata]|nr:hypothetical protein OH77DRAFT_1586382 [Trametes cingulata]